MVDVRWYKKKYSQQLLMLQGKFHKAIIWTGPWICTGFSVWKGEEREFPARGNSMDINYSDSKAHGMVKEQLTDLDIK